MFDIIENIGYGDFAGYVIGWIATSTILIFIFEQFLAITKIKKIK